MFVGPQVFAMTIYSESVVIETPMLIDSLRVLNDHFPPKDWGNKNLIEMYLALDSGHKVEVVTTPDFLVESRLKAAKLFNNQELTWTYIFDMGFGEPEWLQGLLAIAQNLDRDLFISSAYNGVYLRDIIGKGEPRYVL